MSLTSMLFRAAARLSADDANRKGNPMNWLLRRRRVKRTIRLIQQWPAA